MGRRILALSLAIGVGTLCAADLAPTKEERAVAEIRSIAMAVESFGVDHAVYPSSSGRVLAAPAVLSVLVPTFIRTLPELDAFGGTYIYWSEGTKYVLISTGSDRTPDVDYSKLMVGNAEHFATTICHGRTESDKEDIVFFDGKFCQWYLAGNRGS